MNASDELVLTVDELRALRRVADLVLPAFVTTGDRGEARVDAAALRGMALRGLIDLDGDSPLEPVRVADELAEALGPCTSASMLAEVELETTRLAIVIGVEHPVTMLTALDGGFVAVERADADAGEVLERLCRLHEVTEPAASWAFTIDAETQAKADALVLAGDPDSAVAVLTEGGMPEQTAKAWTAAVDGRRLAAAVSVACRLDDGLITAGELRWLVAGDGTAWRVEADEAPADPEQDTPPLLAVVSTVGRDVLRGHLTALLEPQAAEGAER